MIPNLNSSYKFILLLLNLCWDRWIMDSTLHLREHPDTEVLDKATYHCSHSLHRTAALLAACPDLTLSFQDRNCILGWGQRGAGWEHKQRQTV